MEARASRTSPVDRNFGEISEQRWMGGSGSGWLLCPPLLISTLFLCGCFLQTAEEPRYSLSCLDLLVFSLA